MGGMGAMGGMAGMCGMGATQRSAGLIRELTQIVSSLDPLSTL